MDIRADYKSFTDQYGIVHSDKGIVDQNGPRFTAEYFYALKLSQNLNTQDKISIAAAYDFCELVPGLLRRHPTSDEQEGPDDQYAALAVSKELGGSFAKDWLSYGRTAKVLGWDDTFINTKWYSKPAYWVCKAIGYRYNFNNTRPGYWNDCSFMGRQLPLVAHAKLCANEKLGFFWRAAWCVGVILSARNASSQDGKVLAWFMIKASEGGKSWAMRKVAKYWSKKLHEQWEGGIGGVIKAYFSNKSHPSTQWLWDEYGH